MNKSHIDLEYLEQWTWHEPVIRIEMLDLRPALTLSAMLNRPSAPQTGDVLPPLWLWAYFTPAPLAAEIGIDGHPSRGDFLPPVPLLAELLHEHCPGTTMTEFSFRALHPLTDTAPFTLHGQRKGDEVILKAVDNDGQLAVEATALLG